MTIRHPSRTQKQRFVFVCLVVLTAKISHCHDEGKGHTHKPVLVGPAERYEPTAVADRIILTISGDPRTTQSVTWRTSTEVQQGLVELAVADGSPNFPATAKQFSASKELLESDLNKAHYHSFTFQNLSPGTVYAYRVGDAGGNWSEWCQFTTAAARPEPFSFVYFGDAQNSVRSMWSRVVREAYRDAPRAAFLLHAGDLINRAESDGEWGEWFEAGGWLNRSTPSVAIPGNHEQARGLLGRRLSKHWRPTFTLPENGPSGLEETCYTFEYHNLRVIGLNSNTRLDDQAVWLEEVLKASQSEWVVCTFHHPVFSTGSNRDNPELRGLWKPIFDKYGVDLVLQGHDHTYGRTGLDVPSVEQMEEILAKRKADKASEQDAPQEQAIVENVPTGVQAIDEESGTVYVVSVSGPKMYNNTRYEFMERVAEDTQLYQIIHIDGNRLSFEARTAVGEIYDAFELRKQPGKRNQLIDLQPGTPESLREGE